MQNYQFTAQIEKDSETGLYVGIVRNLPWAHTQTDTLDELYQNLKEVIELYLEEITEDDLSPEECEEHYCHVKILTQIDTHASFAELFNY